MNGSKLGFLVPLRVNLGSNLVKVDGNLRVAQVWCKNVQNVVLGWFLTTLNFGQPRVDQGHFGQFDLKMALWVLQCLNGLCHVNLDVLVAPWRKVNIFEIFEVWHANQGWSIYRTVFYDYKDMPNKYLLAKELITCPDVEYCKFRLCYLVKVKISRLDRVRDEPIIMFEHELVGK